MPARLEPASLARLRTTAKVVGAAVAMLWLIHLLFVISVWDPAMLGILPRATTGLVGVVTAPLVHGSWAHLLSNTPTLLVLGIALLYGTPHAARLALPLIWLGAGIGVWLFAREAVHLGASGIAYGLLFFVFLMGILRRDKRAIALALLVFFLHGSMIWGILPLAPGISFEYHAFGALAGIIAAILLRRRDPLPSRRRPAEDMDDAEAGEPVPDLFFDRPRPEDDRRF